MYRAVVMLPRKATSILNKKAITYTRVYTYIVARGFGPDRVFSS